jgi:membrane protein implicated in regulation of membrane protease activity
MALLGLLLMLVAGGLTAGVLLSEARKISPAPEVFGISVGDVSTTGLFLAGLATALVFGIGLSMLLRGLARARRRRVERRQVVRDSRDQQASLAAEKARLERELEQERGRRSSTAQATTTEPVTTERTVVQREPVHGERDSDPGGGDAADDKPRLFRR